MGVGVGCAFPGATAPGLGVAGGGGGGVGLGATRFGALWSALGGSKDPSNAPLQVVQDGSTDRTLEGMER